METKMNDDADSLIGNWTLDLRPSPDAEGYFQPFTVISMEGNSFEGTFYGRSIEVGLLNRHWDRSNEYFHSGNLLNGKVIETTYCPNRQFTAPWVGIKE